MHLRPSIPNSSYSSVKCEGMGLSGKMVRQVEIKSDGDVFHELFSSKPHHISNICPDKVQGVELHEGDWGTVGSIISWAYVHDGKEKIAKDVIEAIDEEKKSVTFKVIEGHVLEEYKSFVIMVHVNTKGENNLVTWTFEYEKLKEDVKDPETFMDFVINVTKDIETHHLQQTTTTPKQWYPHGIPKVHATN